MVFDISSNVVAEQPGDPAARGRRSSQHKPPPHGDATQTRKPAGKTALQKKKKKALNCLIDCWISIIVLTVIEKDKHS